MAAEPASKVVVLAPSPTPDDAYQAFAAGASAVILKTVDPEDLAPLIRQVVDENIIVAPVQDEPVPADAMRLTPRETQVLSRVASGASNATVAVQLWLSEATVKFHLRNIYRKLGANGRTEASRLAYELGLIPRSHTPLTSSPIGCRGSSGSSIVRGAAAAHAFQRWETRCQLGRCGSKSRLRSSRPTSRPSCGGADTRTPRYEEGS